LSDDLYLVCFAEQTGRAVVTEAVAGFGLAGGLLAELVLGAHLLVHHDGLLYPVAGAPTPTDPPLREILQAVCGQRQPQDVGTWLRFLAGDAVCDVRARMGTAGLLTRVRTHRLAGGGDRYLPTDSNAAAWPAIRLARLLCTGELLPVQDGVLAGLVHACGLLKHVLWGPEHAPGFTHADRLRHLLPPPLTTIVAHTEAAIGQHVLTRRRL
jgi:hypothetical protein